MQSHAFNSNFISRPFTVNDHSCGTNLINRDCTPSILTEWPSVLHSPYIYLSLQFAIIQFKIDRQRSQNDRWTRTRKMLCFVSDIFESQHIGSAKKRSAVCENFLKSSATDVNDYTFGRRTLFHTWLVKTNGMRSMWLTLGG